MKLLTTFAYSIALLGLASSALAEIKVIAHPGISDRNVSSNIIADIYLGEASALPSGTKATPIDQSDSQAARNEFYTKAAKKDAAQLKAHWSRLIFTGKGQPPRVAYDNDEVIAIVKSTPGAIGYVSGGTNTQGVNVLLVIP